MTTGWTPPPTFATGEVLSAAMLNAIGANQELLYGLATRPMAPHASLLTINQSLASTAPIWFLRHKEQYLHWEVVWSGTPSEYRVYVKNAAGTTTKIYDPAGIPSGGEKQFYDLTSLGANEPGDNEWYEVTFEITSAGTLQVVYVQESDSSDTTLDPTSGGTWATLPTFVDGQTVTAANLNNIASNVQYLHDILSMPNAPFSCIRTENGSLDNSPANAVWYFTYNQRYMHYAFNVTGGSISTCKIYVDSVEAVDISGPDVNNPNTGVIDLSGYVSTKGEEYPIHFEIIDSSTLHILYLMQAELSSWDPLP
jgi:hypothetical protein